MDKCYRDYYRKKRHSFQKGSHISSPPTSRYYSHGSESYDSYYRQKVNGGNYQSQKSGFLGKIPPKVSDRKSKDKYPPSNNFSPNESYKGQNLKRQNSVNNSSKSGCFLPHDKEKSLTRNDDIMFRRVKDSNHERDIFVTTEKTLSQNKLEEEKVNYNLHLQDMKHSTIFGSSDDKIEASSSENKNLIEKPANSEPIEVINRQHAASNLHNQQKISNQVDKPKEYLVKDSKKYDDLTQQKLLLKQYKKNNAILAQNINTLYMLSQLNTASNMPVTGVNPQLISPMSPLTPSTHSIMSPLTSLAPSLKPVISSINVFSSNTTSTSNLFTLVSPPPHSHSLTAEPEKHLKQNKPQSCAPSFGYEDMLIKKVKNGLGSSDLNVDHLILLKNAIDSTLRKKILEGSENNLTDSNSDVESHTLTQKASLKTQVDADVILKSSHLKSSRVIDCPSTVFHSTTTTSLAGNIKLPYSSSSSFSKVNSLVTAVEKPSKLSLSDYHNRRNRWSHNNYAKSFSPADSQLVKKKLSKTDLMNTLACNNDAVSGHTTPRKSILKSQQLIEVGTLQKSGDNFPDKGKFETNSTCISDVKTIKNTDIEDEYLAFMKSINEVSDNEKKKSNSNILNNKSDDGKNKSDAIACSNKKPFLSESSVSSNQNLPEKIHSEVFKNTNELVEQLAFNSIRADRPSATVTLQRAKFEIKSKQMGITPILAPSSHKSRSSLTIIPEKKEKNLKNEFEAPVVADKVLSIKLSTGLDGSGTTSCGLTPSTNTTAINKGVLGVNTSPDKQQTKNHKKPPLSTNSSIKAMPFIKNSNVLHINQHKGANESKKNNVTTQHLKITELGQLDSKKFNKNNFEITETACSFPVKETHKKETYKKKAHTESIDSECNGSSKEKTKLSKPIDEKLRANLPTVKSVKLNKKTDLFLPKTSIPENKINQGTSSVTEYTKPAKPCTLENKINQGTSSVTEYNKPVKTSTPENKINEGSCVTEYTKPAKKNSKKYCVDSTLEPILKQQTSNSENIDQKLDSGPISPQIKNFSKIKKDKRSLKIVIKTKKNVAELFYKHDEKIHVEPVVPESALVSINSEEMKEESCENKKPVFDPEVEPLVLGKRRSKATLKKKAFYEYLKKREERHKAAKAAAERSVKKEAEKHLKKKVKKLKQDFVIKDTSFASSVECLNEDITNNDPDNPINLIQSSPCSVQSVFQKSTNYQCKKCEDSFATMRALTKHLLVHSSFLSVSQNKKTEILQTLVAKENEFICVICSERFQCLSELNAHTSKIHPEKTFQCNKCTHSFVSPQDFCFHLMNQHGMSYEEASLASLDAGLKSEHQKTSEFENKPLLTFKLHDNRVLSQSEALTKKVSGTSKIIKAKEVIKKVKKAKRNLENQLKSTNSTKSKKNDELLVSVPLASDRKSINPSGVGVLSKSNNKTKKIGFYDQVESVFRIKPGYIKNDKPQKENEAVKQSLPLDVALSNNALEDIHNHGKTSSENLTETQILKKDNKSPSSKNSDLVSIVKKNTTVEDFEKQQDEEKEKQKIKFDCAERTARMLVRNQRKSSTDIYKNKDYNSSSEFSKDYITIEQLDALKVKVRVKTSDKPENASTVDFDSLETDNGAPNNKRSRKSKKRKFNRKKTSQKSSDQPARKRKKYYVYEHELYNMQTEPNLLNSLSFDSSNLGQTSLAGLFNENENEKILATYNNLDYDPDYDYSKDAGDVFLTEDEITSSLLTLNDSSINADTLSRIKESFLRVVEHDVILILEDMVTSVARQLEPTINKPAKALSVTFNNDENVGLCLVENVTKSIAKDALDFDVKVRLDDADICFKSVQILLNEICEVVVQNIAKSKDDFIELHKELSSESQVYSKNEIKQIKENIVFMESQNTLCSKFPIRETYAIDYVAQNSGFLFNTSHYNDLIIKHIPEYEVVSDVAALLQNLLENVLEQCNESFAVNKNVTVSQIKTPTRLISSDCFVNDSTGQTEQNVPYQYIKEQMEFSLATEDLTNVNLNNHLTTETKSVNQLDDCTFENDSCVDKVLSMSTSKRIDSPDLQVEQINFESGLMDLKTLNKPVLITEADTFFINHVTNSFKKENCSKDFLEPSKSFHEVMSSKTARETSLNVDISPTFSNDSNDEEFVFPMSLEESSKDVYKSNLSLMSDAEIKKEVFDDEEIDIHRYDIQNFSQKSVRYFSESFTGVKIEKDKGRLYSCDKYDVSSKKSFKEIDSFSQQGCLHAEKLFKNKNINANQRHDDPKNYMSTYCECPNTLNSLPKINDVQPSVSLTTPSCLASKSNISKEVEVNVLFTKNTKRKSSHTCKKCNTQFPSLKIFCRHQMFFHRNRFNDCKCLICGQCFLRRFYLHSHLKKHSEFQHRSSLAL